MNKIKTNTNQQGFSITKLAGMVKMRPEELFKELVLRGISVKGINHVLDHTNSKGILDYYRQNGRVDFDSLFGPAERDPVSDENLKPKEFYDRKKEDVRDAEAFENNVGNKIEKFFPRSHLSGVFLFIAEQLKGDDKYGREIDHLLHIRNGESHRLLIIEAKNQQIIPEKGASGSTESAYQDWVVKYTERDKSERKKEKIKNVKDQLWHQARAILQMLKPVPDMDLEIEAIALSSKDETKELLDDQKKQDSRVIYRLMGWGDFSDYLVELKKESKVLRIAQSELLRRLRQGIPSPQLGHPDIRDAIDYHRRLRLTLDFGLFQLFEPTGGKWAINGTAGMGKSVLLAYAACVLCSDYTVKMDEVGRLSLHKFDHDKKGIPPLEERRIVLYSLKEKQKRIVEYYWRLLIETFQALDARNELRVQKPEITLWQQGQEIEGNIILIDEAHDLSQKAQERIAGWLGPENENEKQPDQKYLIIACDRHQKLRLIEDGDQARMISGLDFSRCTKKLKRVYRNPFSVYASGLGLMFRWFAPKGVKVIPSETQMKSSFGFDVKHRDLTSANIGCSFVMTEDAHPANNWHHCVSDFPDASTAHSWLMQYNLTNEDVLWVRFAKEDSFFDYEKLQHFQYHNLCTEESSNIIDKYIKGQEFPVVVIEGVGRDFNDYENTEAMFFHRRQLYLCASRATVFLFFICRSFDEDGDVDSIKLEFNTLLNELSVPKKSTSSTQFWGVDFKVPDGDFPFKQFQDILDPVEKTVEDLEGIKEISTDGSSDNVSTGLNKQDLDEGNEEKKNKLKTIHLPLLSRKEYGEKYEIKSKLLTREHSTYIALAHFSFSRDYCNNINCNDLTDQKKLRKFFCEVQTGYSDLPEAALGNKIGNILELVKIYLDHLAMVDSLGGSNGYSLKDNFTPRKLSEYLDNKSWQVIKIAKKISGKVYSIDKPIDSKFLIEKICLDFGSVAPWMHEKVGSREGKFSFGQRPLSFGIFKTILLRIYKEDISPNSLLSKFTKNRILFENKNNLTQVMKTYEIYKVLKALELEPNKLMLHLNQKSQQENHKFNREQVLRLKREIQNIKSEFRIE